MPSKFTTLPVRPETLDRVHSHKPRRVRLDDFVNELLDAVDEGEVELDLEDGRRADRARP